MYDIDSTSLSIYRYLKPDTYILNDNIYIFEWIMGRIMGENKKSIKVLPSTHKELSVDFLEVYNKEDKKRKFHPPPFLDQRIQMLLNYYLRGDVHKDE